MTAPAAFRLAFWVVVGTVAGIVAAPFLVLGVLGFAVWRLVRPEKRQRGVKAPVG